VGDHPVKVPAEAVRQWAQIQASEQAVVDHWIHIANRAAQWGADQELEACCEWIGYPAGVRQLRIARRPKPPTLAELGCNALDAYIYGNPDHGDKQNAYNTIRAALNRLAELEASQ
jgi:hypothetical protein